MQNPIHPAAREVEPLARTRLAKNGNVHLSDPTRWIATAEHKPSTGYLLSVKLFSSEAAPILELLDPVAGFERLSSELYVLNRVPKAKVVLTLLTRILDFALLHTPTGVVDLEMSSLRHFRQLMPWEVLSFMYFGDPRLDEVTDASLAEGGDK